MGKSIFKGGTLLITSGTSHDPDRKHLHIVCNDECDEGNHCLVSITSWVNDLCDPSCRLYVGDHPFVKWDSYIMYRKSHIVEAARLEEQIRSGRITPREPVDPEMLERVIHGALVSKQIPWKVKKYLKRVLAKELGD